MDGVVNGTGTAHMAAIKDPAMRMAGKTGSAQVRRITQQMRDNKNVDPMKWPWKYRDHALFIAFAPVTAPAYCCAVVVEHGAHGPSVAAPIARDLLQDAQTRDILKRGVADRRDRPPASRA
jgi:penicillin-binding protein 2